MTSLGRLKCQKDPKFDIEHEKMFNSWGKSAPVYLSRARFLKKYDREETKTLAFSLESQILFRIFLRNKAQCCFPFWGCMQDIDGRNVRVFSDPFSTPVFQNKT